MCREPISRGGEWGSTNLHIVCVCGALLHVAPPSACLRRASFSDVPNLLLVVLDKICGFRSSCPGPVWLLCFALLCPFMLRFSLRDLSSFFLSSGDRPSRVRQCRSRQLSLGEVGDGTNDCGERGGDAEMLRSGAARTMILSQEYKFDRTLACSREVCGAGRIDGGFVRVGAAGGRCPKAV